MAKVTAGFHLNLKRDGQAQHGSATISDQSIMRRILLMSSAEVMARIGAQPRPDAPLPDSALKAALATVLEAAFGQARAYTLDRSRAPLKSL